MILKINSKIPNVLIPSATWAAHRPLGYKLCLYAGYILTGSSITVSLDEFWHERHLIYRLEMHVWQE